MCLSAVLVNQSLTKTNKKKKISMNARPDCVHDCTGLVLNTCCAVFDILWLLVKRRTLVSLLNVLWSKASRCFFDIYFLVNCWSNPSFAITVLTSRQGANCDQARSGAFTIWPNPIVIREVIVQPQSVTSECFTSTLLPHKSSVSFLNLLFLKNAWSH